MPLSVDGPTRTFRQNMTLAVLLAGVAGAVNGMGFFLLKLHLSHMTGHVASVGESLAGGDRFTARSSVLLLLAFLLGAGTAGGLLDIAEAWRRGRHVLALAAETLVLTGAAAWMTLNPGVQARGPALSLCFAMGLQNAMVTRISGAIVRTTHLTGVLTDLGMELVRLGRWLVLLVVAPLRPPRPPELQQAWLHIGLLGAFVVGAGGGSLLVIRFREEALFSPAVVLFALIALDLRKPRRAATSSTPPPSV
jgi:uncharacterized membrane protein YoaK (UPF0700 family)